MATTINPIQGTSGNDVLTDTAGPDRMMGGAGNDTFKFIAGNLVHDLGQNNGFNGVVDSIIDFHGAGTSDAGVENDLIELSGFSAGTTITFDHYSADRVLGSDGKYTLVENKHLQYYHIVDGQDHSKDGYILVQMSDSTNKLTAQDVKIDSALKEVTINFDDAAPYNGSNPSILDGYSGFDWHAGGGQDIYAINQSNYGGYSLNGTGVAYNGYANFSVDISKHGGGTFQFKDFDIASAWNIAETIQISGLLNGQVVGTSTLTVDNQHLTHFAANWGTVDHLQISYISSTPNPDSGNSGNHIVMDNFHLLV